MSNKGEKKGEARRRGKRNVLARHRHRHGYPFKGRASNSQDRRRSRATAHATGQKACTRRSSSGHVNRWKRCLSRSHVRNVGNGPSIWWAGKTPNGATTRKRLAVSAGHQETGGKQSSQCDHEGDLWRSRRGEKGAWRTYGICGTNQFDLTADE